MKDDCYVYKSFDYSQFQTRLTDNKILQTTFSQLAYAINMNPFCLLVFSIIADIAVLKLKVDKCSRQDNLFMKKVCLENLFDFLSFVFFIHFKISLKRNVVK